MLSFNGVFDASVSYLPNTLVVLLLEAEGPVIEASIGAVIHAEYN